MLSRPTDNGITVKMFFDQEVECNYQVGESEDQLSIPSPWQKSMEDGSVSMKMENLEANTKYFYRINYRKPGAGDIITRPIFHFHTQRPKGSTFTFLVQADPHVDEQSDTALYRRCLKNESEENADFIIDLGDILMTDKLKNAGGKITRDTIVYRSHLMRNFYETFSHSLPLFIALGNHEGEAGWQLNPYGENIAVWNTLERKKYFPNPFPDGFYKGNTSEDLFVGARENYYSWTWGDALFIVLDPYWYTAPKPDANTGWRWTLGKQQYDWLREVLEQSDAKYKFLFCHQLIGGDPNGRGGIEYAQWYEWGGYNKDGTYGFDTNRPGWYKPIKDLLAENKVSVFFHGHDHFFGKQELDCLVYQETPQPSHPNYSSANQANEYGYFEGQILPNSGHLRVTVSEETAKVEYVRAYLAANENNTRKNKDVSATYFVNNQSCYDTLTTSTPVLWNSNYQKEIAFPNPFEEELEIKFEFKQNETITLDIVNLQGQLVNRLVDNKAISPGAYTIYFNGRDHNGSELSKGVYMYHLHSKHKTITSGKIYKN